VFYDANNDPALDPATAYYLWGTAGWGPTYGGLRTKLWHLPIPLIKGSVSVQPNDFSVTVSWETNLSVVVEASTNLSTPVWQPLQTNTLNNGVVNFIDPEWTNYPNRFYRVRSP